MGILPAAGCCFEPAATRTGFHVGIADATANQWRPSARRSSAWGSLARRIGAQALRLAVPAVIATACVTFSPGEASAAMAPGSCNGADVVAHALSAIVNITVVKVVKSDEDASPGKPQKDQIEVFVGSGSVIDPSGVIITNKHVIQDGAYFKVIFHDRSEVPAQLIAAASLVDLALLKVNLPTPLPTLQFADSDDVRVGQPVIAIGNPLGLGTSVSTGVVSALNRDLMRTPFDDFIQTDATINPGNSGGPLLNCQGEMIGVNTALLSNSKLLGSIGLGFALPANDAKFVAAKLRSPETDMPNWIGLHVQDLTEALARIFGRPDLSGAIITEVDPGSPAAQAALQVGDIVVSSDGRQMPDARATLRSIIAVASGQPINLAIWRQDRMQDVSIKGQPWPHMMALRSQVLASPEAVARAQAGGVGMHVTALTPEDRVRLNLGDAHGVLVDNVTQGSQAETIGLVKDDVIEQVGNQPATTPQQVMDMVARGDPEKGDLVALLVRGTTATRWITLFVGHANVANLIAPEQPASSVARDAAVGKQ